jgi:signal transduction histidine kinase
LHLYALVSAELAGITDQPMEAGRWYEQAIAAAQEHGFVQHEGLAYEQASGFYRRLGFGVFADAYLQRARACYARWGADGKVRQLEARHPQLREPPLAGQAVGGAQLDLMAVLKASQAISSEIVLSRLVETLMRVVIEAAGAQRGYLVLMEDQAPWVRAEANGERDQAPVSPSGPRPAAEVLPGAILAYVMRTHEKVLLDDASQPSPFASDGALKRRQAKSVLCLPILRQSDLVGMLYLENSLLAGAFTPDRLTVLEHLAAQAAISLENARLYEALKAETAARVKAAEEAVRRQAELDQARELDKLKSAFVHTVSHELRTPLTSVKGFIEFLEDGLGGPLTPEQQDFVRQIATGTNRLEMLANDLLDYARMDAGTFRLALEEADLGEKIQAVVASFRPQAAYRRLDLRVSLPDRPLALRMDPVRIEQVLNNLLSNAIKFAREGGWVEVRLRLAGDRVVCEVEDAGEGIAPEDVPKLFQRFSQLEGGKRRGGTGLGLSISKGIVEAHGGQIGVSSNPGKGSTFWFSLPLPSGQDGEAGASL